jgi:RTX calcium-binding nonapeptide repeat (4 copies)
VSGAGNDSLQGGLGIDGLIGDSEGVAASGDGGNDVLDLGLDGGAYAIGDHAAPGSTNGAGNDRIEGGSAGDLLIGDSIAGSANAAGNDTLRGRGGDDLLLGDNVDFFTLATIGTTGGNDSLDGGDGADALIAGPANDSLDGGSGVPDFCNGEAGTDNGANCEVLVGVP